MAWVNGVDVKIIAKPVEPLIVDKANNKRPSFQVMCQNVPTCATKLLEIVHYDVCGPIKTISMEEIRCLFTFIDDFLRMIWIYILKAKMSVFRDLRNLKFLLKNKVNLRSNYYLEIIAMRTCLSNLMFT